MEILFKQKRTSTTEFLIVGVYENDVLSETARKIDAYFKGNLMKALVSASFKGKLGQSYLFTSLEENEYPKVLCLGLGKQDDKTEEHMKEIGAHAYKLTALHKATSVSFACDTLKAELIGFGAKITSYKFNKYKTDVKDDFSVSEFYLLTKDFRTAQAEYEKYFALNKGIHTARDMVNEPSNVMTPIKAAERASELSKYGLSVEVYDEKALASKGFNLMLAVAKGGINPPRFVVIQWKGVPEDKSTHAVLVGKGVCFDSGGISLKPANGMEDMKEDLAGAATVLGTMQTLAMRKAKVNIVGIMALVENIPSDKSQHPGDIVTSLSGKTVEVINTDAEGRLVLGDALWYAQERFKAPIVIDLATLTGAIIIALGSEYAGLFANDDELAKSLEQAATITDEKVWRLPLCKAFDDMVVSQIADIRNSTNVRDAGSCTAAAFLKNFIKDGVKWAHIDIAGVTLAKKDNIFCPKGASGFGVQLLNKYIEQNLEK